MKILLENKDLIVAVKPPELISEHTERKDGFADLLAAHNGGYIGVIHRLDRGVGGAMLYAKTPHAAALLSRAVQEHRLGKVYLAITEGIPASPTGELRDLLYYDRQKSKVFPVTRARKGVKEAILTYELLQTIPSPETQTPLSLLSVRPITGRTHQIRVQFASRKLPLLGDRKYGGTGNSGISLACHSITLPDGKKVIYQPTGSPWDWFGSV